MLRVLVGEWEVLGGEGGKGDVNKECQGQREKKWILCRSSFLSLTGPC